MQKLLLFCWCLRHQTCAGRQKVIQPQLDVFVKNMTLKKKNYYCEAGLYNILEMKCTSLCICAHGFVKQPKF